MEVGIAPLIWVIAMLGAVVPLFLVFAARYLANRLVGASGGLTTAITGPLVIPTLQIRGRWQALRTLILMTIVGIGTVIVLMRFVYGLGAVTNLSDGFPWGLWIGFDVMSGVALAAGAFVISATVHIFRLERFEPLVRPAILTGFLGYLLVVAALVVDLGRPYNIWRPLVHWQHHSVLWEVGVCVATYTTVLFIEFLPVVLERLNQFDFITKRLPTIALYRLMRRAMIAFVILGVVLSTLHQSSLGSLWVLLPEKLHPLWYSLYLPFFFWLSAIAVGLAMTIVESTLSSKSFGRGLELDLLADLAKALAVVLFVYLVARVADLVTRGSGALLFDLSLESLAWWLEIGLGVVVPAVLFTIRPLRYNPTVLFSGAFMVVLFGIVLNRLNVSLIGLWHYTGFIYFPSWTEVVVTLTFVTMGVLTFGLAARYLPVFLEEGHQGH